MKRMGVALAVFISFPLAAQVSPQADIEIVESTPIGTRLDNPDIRNAQEVWLQLIGSAKHSLDFEEYYVSNEPGKMLEPVLAAIYAAADRGVKVRLIADSRMYKTYPASIDSLGEHRNIETRLINFGAIAGGIQHSKYFIVDRKEVFVGSQNFDWRSLEHIHELGLRVNNREVAEVFGDVFDLDWSLASDTAKGSKATLVQHKVYPTPIRISEGDGKVALITPSYSPAGYIPDSLLWDEKAITDLISKARRSLTLQFLSYSPRVWGGGTYTVIDDAIRSAAGRGVRVRMIVADWEKGSASVANLKTLSALPNIEVAFSDIPEWSGGYISFARVEHCKYIVADDSLFWLGTANCEKSYFYGTRNLGIVGASPFLAGRLAGIFDKSWNSPYKELISPNGTYKPREHGERK
ncbi:MAG TPA: phospholipase D-like domain-containing protein [Bacteroidota bacterium]|nr:phospholipase D-like domain-containing protein [Bacteroidota bacterium]